MGRCRVWLSVSRGRGVREESPLRTKGEGEHGGREVEGGGICNSSPASQPTRHLAAWKLSQRPSSPSRPLIPTPEEAAHDGTLALCPALPLGHCPPHTVILPAVSCYITAEAAPSPSVNHCLGMAGTVPGMQEGACGAGRPSRP
ncbi:hypothetical protein E2C01_047345 [Portunus trituberculatus]|uniref:Uncharacterized protein n=1 Tax=Portunus trituberculatus TaxID=210409 RepID=A0A5B7G3C3_PORTR|nr:hypothetical protein [Portunus trituberculatus]